MPLLSFSADTLKAETDEGIALKEASLQKEAIKVCETFVLPRLREVARTGSSEALVDMVDTRVGSQFGDVVALGHKVKSLLEDAGFKVSWSQEPHDVNAGRAWITWK